MLTERNETEAKTSKKEKRRSSFIHGRRSRTFLHNLPVPVPSGLSRDEKLAFITVEKCLASLQAELKYVDELQQFTVLTRECVTKELYEHRVSDDVPNVREPPAVELQLKQLPIYIDKLKNEEDSWKDLLSLQCAQTDEAHLLMSGQSVRDSQSVVDSQQSVTALNSQSVDLPTNEQEFIDKKPDYKLLATSIDLMYRDMLTMISDLQNYIHMIKQRRCLESVRSQQRSLKLHDSLIYQRDRMLSCMMDCEPYKK